MGRTMALSSTFASHNLQELSYNPPASNTIGSRVQGEIEVKGRTQRLLTTTDCHPPCTTIANKLNNDNERRGREEDETRRVRVQGTLVLFH